MFDDKSIYYRFLGMVKRKKKKIKTKTTWLVSYDMKAVTKSNKA